MTRKSCKITTAYNCKLLAYQVIRYINFILWYEKNGHLGSDFFTILGLCLMGPGTGCFLYQWVQLQTYESRTLFT